MDKVIRETRTYTLTRRVRVRTLNATETGVAYHWEGTPALYTVTAEFDVDRIMHELADKAVRSKSGTARYMKGKIVVKVKPQ